MEREWMVHVLKDQAGMLDQLIRNLERKEQLSHLDSQAYDIVTKRLERELRWMKSVMTPSRTRNDSQPTPFLNSKKIKRSSIK